jgi:hypothetical protein
MKKPFYSQAYLIQQNKLKDNKMKDNKAVGEKLKDKVNKQEIELYSKVCVAESIKFTVGKASNIIRMKKIEKLSCHLAAILAR